MTGRGAEEFDLLEPDEAEGFGDEWEDIDIDDTAVDRMAKQHDRAFNEFRERLKDADQFKVEASVFDDATFAALYKLVQDGHLQAIGGPISTGKEANVYEAVGADDAVVAIKVYRISASDFRDMRDYLEGDPRFDRIGNDKREVVLAWVSKEFANLRRALAAGVAVPRPIAVERNVLVMEYLSMDGGRARRLTEVHIENPEIAYEVVTEYMRRLYDAGLVHGDLSEYNIVLHDRQLYFLDMGQAVTIHHPNADEFLRRDCQNITAFFGRLGEEHTEQECYDIVTGGDAE